MGKLRDRALEAAEALTVGSSAWDKFRADFPELSDALLGFAGESKEATLYRHTLFIFVDGDRLKWSLHAKGNGQSVFGAFKDRLPAIEDVEQALQAGDFELKRRR